MSARSAAWYAELYRRDGLQGGHVILLGAGNEGPAREALAAYPGGLQLGGGVSIGNAAQWLEAGASHVIVTSWIFRDARIEWERLRELSQEIGKERPMMIGASRKSFIGKLLGGDVTERLGGSIACALWAVMQGAQIIRTHDVRATSQALRMVEEIQQRVS